MKKVITCVIIIMITIIAVIKIAVPTNINSKKIIEYNQIYPIKKQPRILVYHSGDYDVLPDYAKLAIIINKNYCDKWGYDYKYFYHTDKSKIPPYWTRVYDLKNILSDNNYDYIMYLDFDAIFADHSLSITDILNYVDPDDKYSMYIGKDPSIMHVINSGCFIIKNNNISRDIVNTWMNVCYNSKDSDNGGVCASKWTYDSKWTCKSCAWAGVNYEQGSLGELYKTLYKNDILLLDRYYLSNHYEDIKSYITHLMGHKNSNRQDFFSSQIIDKGYKTDIDTNSIIVYV